MATPDSICSILDCGKPHYGRGWCNMHYARWRRTGDPLAVNTRYGPKSSAQARFWKHVNRNGPTPAHRPELGQCWVWTASLVDGYGQFHAEGKRYQAHRWIYERQHGPIPAGLEPDHLCRNRACVNDSHLDLVTHLENMHRGTSPSARHFRQTHCIRGHAFTPENTYIPPGESERVCLTCQRERRRQRWLSSHK